MATFHLIALDLIVRDVREYVSGCDVQSLSELTEIAPTTLYAIRNGALPTVRTLRRLCKAVELSGGFDEWKQRRPEIERLIRESQVENHRPAPTLN